MIMSRRIQTFGLRKEGGGEVKEVEGEGIKDNREIESEKRESKKERDEREEGVGRTEEKWGWVWGGRAGREFVCVIVSIKESNNFFLPGIHHHGHKFDHAVFK
jgi:hypothetical protein